MSASRIAAIACPILVLSTVAMWSFAPAMTPLSQAKITSAAVALTLLGESLVGYRVLARTARESKAYCPDEIWETGWLVRLAPASLAFLAVVVASCIFLDDTWRLSPAITLFGVMIPGCAAVLAALSVCWLTCRILLKKYGACRQRF